MYAYYKAEEKKIPRIPAVVESELEETSTKSCAVTRREMSC